MSEVLKPHSTPEIERLRRIIPQPLGNGNASYFEDAQAIGAHDTINRLEEQLEAMREALTFLRDGHDEHDPRCASLFEPPSRSMECDCELGIIEGALRVSGPASGSDS